MAGTRPRPVACPPTAVKPAVQIAHGMISRNHGPAALTIARQGRRQTRRSIATTSRGVTMAVGFASIAATSASVASAYGRRRGTSGARAKTRYCQTAVHISSPQRTSFRPDVHPTASTWSGCTANRIAPKHRGARFSRQVQHPEHHAAGQTEQQIRPMNHAADIGGLPTRARATR